MRQEWNGLLGREEFGNNGGASVPRDLRLIFEDGIVWGGLVDDPGVVGVASGNIPTDFYLKQSYPNPFNPETTIVFGLANAAEIRLEIFNIIGQKVRTLVDTKFSSGAYSFRWEGKNDAGKKVASGI